MSRAEDYIREHTKRYSNSYWDNPWLTTEDARKAVEIAREEMIEWIDSHWQEYGNVYGNVDANGVVCFGHWKNDLRKAMKDE